MLLYRLVTCISQLWACLALGCGRKFSAFTELTRHINENHAVRVGKSLGKEHFSHSSLFRSEATKCC
jgi:hypothetical protein